MDLKEFKSGTFRQQYQYRSFTPWPVNHIWVWSNPKINTLLEEVNHKLGSLDAFSKHVPDVNYFIQMHVVKEATASSRIEGTRTNVEEALLRPNEIAPERRNDWQEVQNHIAAINFPREAMSNSPTPALQICAWRDVAWKEKREQV